MNCINQLLLSACVACLMPSHAHSANNQNGVDRKSNPEMFVEIKKADGKESKTAEIITNQSNMSFSPKSVTLNHSHWPTLFHNTPELMHIENPQFTLPVLLAREHRSGSNEAIILVYAPHTPPGRDPVMDGLREFLPARGIATLALVYETPTAIPDNSSAQHQLSKINISQLARTSTAFLEREKYSSIGIAISSQASPAVLEDMPIPHTMGAKAWIWVAPVVDHKTTTKLGDIPLPILEIGHTIQEEAYRRNIENPRYEFKHLWGSRFGSASATLPISQAIQGFLKKNRHFNPGTEKTLEQQ